MKIEKNVKKLKIFSNFLYKKYFKVIFFSIIFVTLLLWGTVSSGALFLLISGALFLLISGALFLLISALVWVLIRRGWNHPVFILTSFLYISLNADWMKNKKMLQTNSNDYPLCRVHNQSVIIVDICIGMKMII